MTDTCDPLFRRDFFKTLGLVALPVLTQGCDAEPEPSRFRAKPTSKAKSYELVDIQVGRALLSQALLNDRERCSLPGKLGSLAEVGRQVRITRPEYGPALYTVDELREEDNPDLVRMGLNARQRLATSDPFAGTVTNLLTANHLSDSEAMTAGEFVERLADNTQNTGLVAIAPHGGDIEYYTDTLAVELVAALWDLYSVSASSWVCKGWRPEGQSAFDAWHIRSTDLDPDSFLLLPSIANRGFAYAVSFHGMSGSAGILIGGGGDLDLKTQIRQELLASTNNQVEVTIASEADVFNGDSPLNIVNWLTAGGEGGIQLELDLATRANEELRAAVVSALAKVFGPLL